MRTTITSNEQLEKMVSDFKADPILREYYSLLAQAQTARIPYLVTNGEKATLLFNEPSALEKMVQEKIVEHTKEKYPEIEINFCL